MSPKSFEAVRLKFCRDEPRLDFASRRDSRQDRTFILAAKDPRFAVGSRRDFGRREVASRRESRRDSR